ncbi:hypothetical protein [Pseudoxanthomonas japonensis]|uniref:hypothetical protein n=1 Tax=Pseudoxanthomonas japonensis TaxID=69284 RepID=UPI000DAFE6BE|nr:hypothetical protein [Pseudoxanthomonas japonensis]PZQ32798.1 MAG: hypothetical protein DI562_02850 [Stenotrophomonas acidaminiphila]
MLGYLGAIALLVFAVYLMVGASKTANAMDREAFERTNAAGVQEFESYDQLVKERNRGWMARSKAWLSLMALAGAALLALATYIQRDSAQTRAAIDEERYYNYCKAAWDEYKGSLEYCRKWCEFPANKGDCRKVFGSADGPVGDTRQR